MKKIIQSIRNYIARQFLPDEITIQNKLCNLIIGFTLIGTVATFFFSQIIAPNIKTSLVIVAALIFISISLYLSAYKHKPTLAAVIIILFINELVFPLMYYICGGIHCGMGMWFIVGLIFPFLVLNGTACAIVSVLSCITLSTCFILEYLGIIQPTPLEGFAWTSDVIQSMLLVALIFGAIFKVQTYIYTKQNNALEAKEAELLETLSKLEAASAAKSDFLANMSHEIRTPINAIMGINEIILRDCEDPETIQNANRIQAASNNLLSLVNNILDFSKIESGKIEILNEDYSLSSVLNDCYNIIFLRAYNKGIAFQIVNDPTIPENLNGDQFHIFQIISNLLTNAVKYTNSGKIILSVTQEKLDDNKINLIVSVKDTGVGIAPEDINLLFQSFQRLDERRNRTIEGTGLGLAITQRLVEQMGGQIDVHSELGVGSTFTATIPQNVVNNVEIGDFSKRYEDALTESETAPKKAEKFIAPEAKVLVVDDVRMNLIVVNGLLKTTQVQIDTALSGREALELTDKNKYDIIFMDHMMPEMDGIETLHAIKERKNVNLDTPIVALTANAIKGAEEEYKKAGFDNYLSKPVHGIDLENMIQSYLPESKIQSCEE